ncbi:MAG: hypothetical protein KVP17_002915 [Porospora cf. gigantea B]|uniref:uncharacterized protein n=1 Tax=Porospora cf. gigantea B TaxID=2853592 RepID=UPI003571B777|nr:MAG: hypothetical protein KVP17_002915 [Porospora cf. gigantea B]
MLRLPSFSCWAHVATEEALLPVEGLLTDVDKLKKMAFDISWRINRRKSDLKMRRPELVDAFKDDPASVPYANQSLPRAKKLEGDPNICQSPLRKMPESLKEFDWYSDKQYATSNTMVVFFYGVPGDVAKRMLAREMMWTQFPEIPFYFVYGMPYYIPDINQTAHENDLEKGRQETAGLILKKEKKLYGDGVVGDFPEHYNNLPAKTLFMITEGAELCPGQRFMAKHDIDNITNYSLLIPRLERLISVKKTLNWYLGSKYFNMPTIRDPAHKNYESVEQYPYKTFVTYCGGPFYVLSMDLCKRLADLKVYPFLMPKNEDAFVGHLVNLVGGEPSSILNGFPLTSYLTKEYGSKLFVDIPCQMVMSLHSIKTDSQLRAMWNHFKGCKEKYVVDYSDKKSLDHWRSVEKNYKKIAKSKGLVEAAAAVE